MNFLSFLFRTVDHFVTPDSAKEHETMQREAQNEWVLIDINNPDIPETQKNMRFRAMRFVKKNTQNWIACYAMSVLHLILIKIIGDWMNQNDTEEPEDEEEEFRRYRMMKAMSKAKF